MQQSQSHWTGFSKGTTAIPAPVATQEYLAYMLPDKPILHGDFGDSVRLEYNVFVPSENGTVRYVMSELGALTNPPTARDKLVQRLCAVNGIVPDQFADLSLLSMEGYCIITTGTKNGFVSIASAKPVPATYTIPEDIIDNPAEKPFSNNDPGF